jgi:two-component system KDP operon response regulator KdpE
MINTTILVIDDEAAIRKLLEITLQSHGFKVLQAASAIEGLEKTIHHSPDLILLDLGLPDESGHSLLLKLRAWWVKPLIILSVVNAEDDIVKALDNGANDYLVKPFRAGELLARVRSALRGVSAEPGEPVVRCQELEIDLSARTVRKNNVFLKLTATQYSLLALFCQHRGKVLTHQFLLREIWGADHTDQLQYLRVFVAQLRKKIERDGNSPELIVTESGVGYRFAEPDR